MREAIRQGAFASFKRHWDEVLSRDESGHE
jgi:hypothetical protein